MSTARCGTCGTSTEVATVQGVWWCFDCYYEQQRPDSPADKLGVARTLWKSRAAQGLPAFIEDENTLRSTARILLAGRR